MKIVEKVGVITDWVAWRWCVHRDHWGSSSLTFRGFTDFEVLSERHPSGRTPRSWCQWSPVSIRDRSQGLFVHRVNCLNLYVRSGTTLLTLVDSPIECIRHQTNGRPHSACTADTPQGRFHYEVLYSDAARFQYFGHCHCWWISPLFTANNRGVFFNLFANCIFFAMRFARSQNGSICCHGIKTSSKIFWSK